MILVPNDVELSGLLVRLWLKLPIWHPITIMIMIISSNTEVRRWYQLPNLSNHIPRGPLCSVSKD